MPADNVDPTRIRKPSEVFKGDGDRYTGTVMPLPTGADPADIAAGRGSMTAAEVERLRRTGSPR